MAPAEEVDLGDAVEEDGEVGAHTGPFLFLSTTLGLPNFSFWKR